MSDKFPFFAAESGTWKTTSPNPHIDLSGTALTLGTYPAQTFKAAADDATLDFASTNTCTIVVWVDASNWKRYEGAVWTDAATDTLDLSAATLMGAAGTISADASVSVVASLPSVLALANGGTGATTAADARTSLSLVPGTDVAKQMAVATAAPTTANITAAVWRHYLVDISGVTAARSWILPTCAVGDRARVTISATHATAGRELVITAGTGATLAGLSAGTEWSRIWQVGESVEVVCLATNAWYIAADGRKPTRVNVYADTAQSVASATWTKILINTAAQNIGGVADTTNNRIVLRRSGSYHVQATYWSTGIVDQNGVASAMYVGGALKMQGITTQASRSTTGNVGNTGVWSGSLSAGDVCELYGYQGNSSSQNSHPGAGYAFLSIQEQIP